MTFNRAAMAVDDAELAERAKLLAALGHPIRLRIVRGLVSGECCVGSMVECLGLPQPLVSRHLAVLRDAGVVAVEHEGRRRRYSLSHPCAGALIHCLDSRWGDCMSKQKDRKIE
jgi:DNA-binding transcriptional ArsR family regulator